MTTKSEMGKKSRQAGSRFELKVRKDLESKGWIVDKWTNNVEFFQLGKVHPETFMRMHPARSNRFNMRSTGFPDFIAFRKVIIKPLGYYPETTFNSTEVIGVESKMAGILSKAEKEKCQWYLDNNIFSKILIASKDGSEIVYKEFERGLKK